MLHLFTYFLFFISGLGILAIFWFSYQYQTDASLEVGIAGLFVYLGIPIFITTIVAAAIGRGISDRFLQILSVSTLGLYVIGAFILLLGGFQANILDKSGPSESLRVIGGIFLTLVFIYSVICIVVAPIFALLNESKNKRLGDSD